ncbi:hypothetical protein OnM2_030082 [Erysiphe neolycopersici]|uniref:Uncharacterized protein n=1 Tax=Erysiphe neolycopersici TaxID=212602 RepID=A0A420HZ85_9PEZI|nr:hypothetical protein OnM2_030082 [Erysiphe neolycopersici]
MNLIKRQKDEAAAALEALKALGSSTTVEDEAEEAESN